MHFGLFELIRQLGFNIVTYNIDLWVTLYGLVNSLHPQSYLQCFYYEYLVKSAAHNFYHSKMIPKSLNLWNFQQLMLGLHKSRQLITCTWCGFGNLQFIVCIMNFFEDFCNFFVLYCMKEIQDERQNLYFHECTSTRCIDSYHHVWLWFVFKS